MFGKTSALLAVLLAVCVATLASARADQHRIALVLGNGQYTALPRIAACNSSPHMVAAALKRAGFEVTEKLNLSNGQMGVALGDFADAIAQTPDTVAVAYVCGAAVEFDGRLFLLPVSANLTRDADILTQGVVARLLTNAVLRSNVAAGLLLLDSAGLPGRPPLALASLADPAAMGARGFAAVQNIGPLPDGPSPFAAAIVAGFAGPEIELRAMLAGLRDSLPATPALAVVVDPPTSLAWLAGGPAPPPAPAAVPAAPAVAPAPAPAAAQAAAPAAGPTRAEPARPATAADAAPAVLGAADLRRVQLALQRLGYYDGAVDGLAGPETLAAIRRFQHELRADMTGRLTNDQLARLLAAAR